MNNKTPSLLLTGPEKGTVTLNMTNLDTDPPFLDLARRARERWSTTMPAKSGWYWCRDPRSEVKPFIIEITEAADGRLSWVGKSLDKYFAGCEWWPIPVTPPEE